MDKIVHLQPSAESLASSLNEKGDVPLKDRIIAAIKNVYDPEIPVNLYDLGLIYDIEVADGNDHEKTVHIKMTLTAPACPVADLLPQQVVNVVKQIEGVGEVEVDLVFDPPWTKERMSEEAKLLLDML